MNLVDQVLAPALPAAAWWKELRCAAVPMVAGHRFHALTVLAQFFFPCPERSPELPLPLLLTARPGASDALRPTTAWSVRLIEPRPFAPTATLLLTSPLLQDRDQPVASGSMHQRSRGRPSSAILAALARMRQWKGRLMSSTAG